MTNGGQEITRLEDYYPTRAETAILRARQLELRQFAGPGPILIEYGAGSGVRTELVLDALAAPQRYVSIDVAHEYSACSRSRLGRGGVRADMSPRGVAAKP